MEGTDATLRDEVASWIGRSDGKTTFYDIPELDVSLGTTVGNVRSDNQDRLVVAAIPDEWGSSYLFALCDGLGGMRDGAICSTLALSTIIVSLLRSEEKVPTTRLYKAALAANAEIRARYHETGGCTLSAVLATRNDIALINIGDSRIYGYNPGNFLKLTKDDTVSEHIKKYQKTPDSPANRRFSNQLTQFIGSGERFDSSSLKWLNGGNISGYVISSDGLHSIDQTMLGEITMVAPSSAQVVRRLVNISLWGNSKDNASIICVPRDIRQKISPIPAKDHLVLWSPYGRADFFEGHRKVGITEEASAGQPDLIPLAPTISERPRKETAKPRKKSRSSRSKPKIHAVPGK